MSCWRVLAACWAAVPAATAVLFTQVPIRSLSEAEGGESMTARRLLAKPVFWLLAVLMFAAGASELAMVQWASAFAEQGLGVTKSVGDIVGPCLFSALQGVARVFYAKRGGKVDLLKYIIGCGVVCAASYLCASFAPHPALSLLGCALCGLSVGILWPGVFSVAAVRCRGGGTALFALLALAGDVGCTCGPTLVGIVSGATEYYVSPENIYIANEHYNGSYSTSTTELVRFHYEDGTITGTATGVIKGTLNDSFSMNEYNGMLRVVSTYEGDSLSGVREFVGDLLNTYYEDNWIEHNALYVLDENLQTVGYIGDLAEGETIRSARFFGDTGYFVTFRQTDPLFSVDLSDPANPKILGELKIDGFSSYLHFYGENLLLGIGYDADAETGITNGLKLSMFDISDPTDVKEVNRYTIPGVTWCPAIEDYKAIMISPEKNLFGFFCDDRYLAFSYDPENGFTRELLYDFFADGFSTAAEYNNLRGLYIGNTFYLAGDAFVITFDMKKEFEKTAVLPLYEEETAKAD